MNTEAVPGRQGLADLIGRVREASLRAGFGPERVRDLLAEVLAADSDWLDPSFEHRDEAADWALYPVYRDADARVSMMIAVFKAAVPSPAHDHGTWAVVGIHRGRERETRYRKTDDATVAGRARLEVERTLVNPRGSISVVPEDAIHSVEALDGRDAVSLHVYGADIVTQERSTYDLIEGTKSVFRPDFAVPGGMP